MHPYLLLIFLTISTAVTAQNTRKISVLTNKDTTSADTLTKKIDGANITFVHKHHDIGAVFEGSELSFDFAFTNTGNEPLLISNVRTSCHCTIASFPNKPILPGESKAITLKLDTKMIGQFTKVVAVYTNAVELPRAMLNIKWTVIHKPKEKEGNLK